jgi:hypothetical protein
MEVHMQDNMTPSVTSEKKDKLQKQGHVLQGTNADEVHSLQNLQEKFNTLHESVVGLSFTLAKINMRLTALETQLGGQTETQLGGQTAEDTRSITERSGGYHS